MERGAQIIYGIRPEHLTIGQGPVAAEVVLVEPTGAEIQVTTKFGADHLIATVRERLDLPAGDTDRHRARTSANCICSTQKPKNG